MRWTTLFSTYQKQLATKVTDPLKTIFDKKKIALVSGSFLHWQVCSIVLVFAFIGYSYMYWNYIFVVGDQRYIFNGIIIHVLWIMTWLVMTLPLLAVWHQWQSLKAQALYFIISRSQVDELDVNSLITAINDLQPGQFPESNPVWFGGNALVSIAYCSSVCQINDQPKQVNPSTVYENEAIRDHFLVGVIGADNPSG